MKLVRFSNVGWKNQTKTTETGTINNNIYVPIEAGSKQRMFRVNRFTYITDLSALVSPTYIVPHPGIASLLGYMNGSINDTTLGRTYIDGIHPEAREWRLISEHLEPYEKQGGRMLRWVQEYMCVGTWESYTTLTPAP